jgi:hypothetical protein
LHREWRYRGDTSWFPFGRREFKEIVLANFSAGSTDVAEMLRDLLPPIVRRSFRNAFFNQHLARCRAAYTNDQSTEEDKCSSDDQRNTYRIHAKILTKATV